MTRVRTITRFKSVDQALELGTADLLTAAERSRLQRLDDPRDRDAYIAAHVLVRTCAADLLGIRVEEVGLRQDCAACGSGQHGRPYLVGGDAYVSLAHARGFVAAVASLLPCGIDVECSDGSPVARALTAREQDWLGSQPEPGHAFTRLWVRKEALVKAGAGSLGEAGELDVLDGGEPGEQIAGFAVTEWSSGGAVGACVVRSAATQSAVSSRVTAAPRGIAGRESGTTNGSPVSGCSRTATSWS